MLTTAQAFSGFAVDDIPAALVFYRDTLGLSVRENEMGFLNLELPGGAVVLVYSKEDHVPATYTVLNFEVENLDAALDELEAAAVSILRYDGMPQDDRGALRGLTAARGPDVAWFNDPAGNILSILQSS